MIYIKSTPSTYSEPHVNYSSIKPEEKNLIEFISEAIWAEVLFVKRFLTTNALFKIRCRAISS